jgi:hypothetical protein
MAPNCYDLHLLSRELPKVVWPDVSNLHFRTIDPELCGCSWRFDCYFIVLIGWIGSFGCSRFLVLEPSAPPEILATHWMSLEWVITIVSNVPWLNHKVWNLSFILMVCFRRVGLNAQHSYFISTPHRMTIDDPITLLIEPFASQWTITLTTIWKVCAMKMFMERCSERSGLESAPW